MVKEILYTTALDENGELIHVGNAEKGRTYFCPLCQAELILKKSGKVGKGSKRTHFAHHQLTTNCTPEGVLHLSFKKLLIDLLERRRSEGTPLLVDWNCKICSTKNRGNLLAKTASVAEEYNLQVCRPDIALLDREGNAIAAIEIVVTHVPEEEVLRYYETSGVTLVQINLSSEKDLESIEAKITNPEVVTCCLNPKCSSHKHPESLRKLIGSVRRCEHCKQPMRTCQVEVNNAFGNTVTHDFTDGELTLAAQYGVRFRVVEHESSREKSHVISCLTCERNSEAMKALFQRMRSRYGGRRF